MIKIVDAMRRQAKENELENINGEVSKKVLTHHSLFYSKIII